MHLIYRTTWFLCVDKRLSYPETDVCTKPCCFSPRGCSGVIRFPPPYTHTHTSTASFDRSSRGWANGQNCELSNSSGYSKRGSVAYPCSELGQMWPPRWSRCVWPRPFMFFTAMRHRWLRDLSLNPQQCFGVTSHASTVQNMARLVIQEFTEGSPLYWKWNGQQKTVHFLSLKKGKSVSFVGAEKL